MEKVVLVNGGKLEEVNDMLKEGWKIKIIESTSSDGYCSAYFVLEKE